MTALDLIGHTAEPEDFAHQAERVHRATEELALARELTAAGMALTAARLAFNQARDRFHAAHAALVQHQQLTREAA